MPRDARQLWLGRHWRLLSLVLVTAIFSFSFLAAALLAEGAIHPMGKRRASDTAALAYSMAQATGAHASKVKLRADDGTQLDAWWLVPANGSKRGVIVCHGVADSAYGVLGYALLFLNHKYSVLVPESRGHGESKGFDTYGVLESSDTVRWLQWMRAQGVSDVFGFGESLGGSILIQALAKGAPFRAIIAECPYSSFTNVAIERVGRVISRPLAYVLVEEGVLYVRLRYGVNLATARPVDAIAHTRVPVLLIHGLADNETSPDNTRVLAAANRECAQTWFVPEAKHTGAYAADPTLFERKVLLWLGKEGQTSGWLR